MCSKWFARHFLGLAAILVLTGVASASPPRDAEGSVLRLQIIGSTGTTEGTCFLVHQERRGHEVVHYFLTSARLLDPAAVGERRTTSLRIRVVLDESTVIEAKGSDVVLPGAVLGLDVAVVKAVSTNTSLVPLAVSMEAPDSGRVFVVRGYRGSELTILTERVRFRSTRLVIGDRTAADVAGLIGGPAIVEGGVFGLVSECSSSRLPVIALLSAARGFLSRSIPGWAPMASATPAFTLEQRVIDGPLVQVACDAITAADVEVPITLAPSESALEATAAFTNPSALRLGEITVLSLHHRLVKLRFTMMGVRPPPFPAVCPPGQALITVGLNVVVLPRP